MIYQQIFGGTLLAPSQVGYNLLAIGANATIQWPVEQQIAGGNVAAPIIDVNATIGGLSITCPDATLVSPGSSITWNNIGAFTVTIKDAAGGTILSLAAGQAWVTYLYSNTTAAGGWRTFQLGAGTSAVNAASLAGFGVQAIGATLNQNMSVAPQAISYTVLTTDQAKLLVWTGGSGTFTLPNPATAGSSWFIAVKNLGSGTLTLTPTVGNIDATATKVLNSLDSAFIGCDGVQYFTVGFGRAVASTFNFISINVGGGVNYTLSGGQLNQVAYKFTGVLTANIQVIVPASVQQYWVDNSTSGAFTLSIGTSGQASPPVIPQGNRNICYCDGSNVFPAVTGTVVYPISTVNGGTGLVSIAAGSILYASATNVLSQLTSIINPGTLEWSISTQLYIGASAFPILDATHGIVAYYDRTAVEIAKGITPVNKAYVPQDIRRFGGIGDGGTTDNATPINNAYAAINSGGTQPFGGIYFPAGNYVYRSALTFSGQKRPYFRGDGSVQSRLTYGGVNTTNNCITIGDGIVPEPGWNIRGLGFYSATVMTGGAGLYAKGLVRSYFSDVHVSDQDTNSNFYIACWLDGVDLLTWDGIQCRGSNTALRVNGRTGFGLADFIINDGKIPNSGIGLHVAGSFGGIHVGSVDIINNSTNVLIDNSQTGVSNREIIFTPQCAIDSACTTHDAATFDGINVDIQDTGGSIFFKNTWCASAGTLIRCGASFQGLILFWGGYMYNAFNTFGGNGHAVDVANANAVLYFNGTYFRNNQGAGVASSVVTSNIIFDNPFFAADVVNPVGSNINANGRTAHVSRNQAVWGTFAAGDQAVWPTAVNGAPTFGFSGTGGSLQAWAATVGNPWFSLGHSRGITPGSHVALLVNDQLGGISFEGSDGTAFRSGAQIVSFCTVAPAANQITANLVFKTNPGTGAVSARTLSEVADFFGPAGSTAMTAGWTWIPSSAGPPTGVPAAIAGQVPLHYDRTNNKMYVYNAGWKKGQVTGVDVIYA